MANLTLSLDDDLLKQSRLYAVQHDTSVNALVREYLETLVTKAKDAEQAERLRDLEEMHRLLEEAARLAQVPDDYKWRREDAYEGRPPRWNKP
jgi:plasmid stability protein